METPMWEARRNKERGTDTTTQHTTPDKDGTHNFYARLSLSLLPKIQNLHYLGFFVSQLKGKEGTDGRETRKNGGIG
jgi:hypothetical protein